MALDRIKERAIIEYYDKGATRLSFECDALQLFQRRWAVLTAGTAERHNSMLVAWGGLGTLWEMPVATAYVARARHTHGFMEASDAFTLAFFPESMRRQYVKFGTVSGQECADKAALAGVTDRKSVV